MYVAYASPSRGLRGGNMHKQQERVMPSSVHGTGLRVRCASDLVSYIYPVVLSVRFIFLSSPALLMDFLEHACASQDQTVRPDRGVRFAWGATPGRVSIPPL